MTQIVTVRWQERRGTAAALAALNEVPLSGERILETDTRKEKIGDGITHYNDLDYVGTGVEVVASSGITVTTDSDGAKHVGITDHIEITTSSYLTCPPGDIQFTSDAPTPSDVIWGAFGLPTGVTLSASGLLHNDGSITDGSEVLVLICCSNRHGLRGTSSTVLLMSDALPDPDWADRFSLLPWDGADGDTTSADKVSGNTWTFNGTAKLSSTFKKFGTTGLYLAGGGYLTSGRAATDWKWMHDGATPWMYEGWVYPLSPSASQLIFDTGAASPSNAGVTIWMDASGLLTAAIAVQRSASYGAKVEAGAFNIGTWNFVKVLFDPAASDGKPLRIFLNGPQTQAGAFTGPAITTDPKTTANIGRYGFGNSLFWKGHLDEQRITKGLVDYSTTAPTVAFPTHG